MTGQARPHGLPDAFTAHTFAPELAEVYLSTFRALRREAEARPGLATLQAMVAERAAHTFTRLKAYDASPEPIYAPDYERASRSFTEHVKNILASAKDQDDTDVTVRTAIRGITEATIEAVDAAVEDGTLTDADRRELLRRLSRNLHEIWPE